MGHFDFTSAKTWLGNSRTQSNFEGSRAFRHAYTGKHTPDISDRKKFRWIWKKFKLWCKPQSTFSPLDVEFSNNSGLENSFADHLKLAFSFPGIYALAISPDPRPPLDVLVSCQVVLDSG
jgi:hypothetical protein